MKKVHSNFEKGVNFWKSHRPWPISAPNISFCYGNFTNFVSCIWCFVTCSYWLMEDPCIPKNIYICKFKVVIILLYNLFQLFNVYGLSPPIYAICPLASPYFTVPNIDYFWRVIKYAVKQSLSRLFSCKTFIANVKEISLFDKYSDTSFKGLWIVWWL